MSALPFTRRELTRAWRELSDIAKPTAGNSRKNSQRLLLFYAVECGLKAVWLKRQNRNLFTGADIEKINHNLHLLLQELRVGKALSLPQNIQLRPVAQSQTQILRTGDISILHQVWRYGGESINPSDQACENKLQQLLNWILGELK